MVFVNLCGDATRPHEVTLVLDGAHVTVPPSGIVARVSSTAAHTRVVGGMPVQVPLFGDVVGLPEPDGVSIFIVSGMVLGALKEAGCRRADVVAPATSPTDGAIRNDRGQVVAVTRLNGLV